MLKFRLKFFFNLFLVKIIIVCSFQAFFVACIMEKWQRVSVQNLRWTMVRFWHWLVNCFLFWGIGKIFNVKLFELFVCRKFCEVLVILRLFRSNETNKFCKLLPHKKSNLPHIYINAQNYFAFWIKMIANKLWIAVSINILINLFCNWP